MKLTTALGLVLLLALPTSSWAAKVLQSKNGKVLIDLEGATVAEADEFFLISPATGKKTAVVRIKQIKNGKAVAEVLKGKTIVVGSTLEAKASSGAPAATPTADHPMSAPVADEATPETHEVKYQKFMRNSYGLLGEYIMPSMTASFSRTSPTTHVGTTSMKGSGMGVGGYYNYMLAQKFSVSAEASYQQFNANGSTAITSDCGGTCDVKINYLSFFGMARYYFSTNKIRAWAGVGGGYLMAASKSSSVLNASQISTNEVISIGAGGEYQLSKKNFIPFSLQYDMFPASPSVKANMISIRAGYGWNL